LRRAGGRGQGAVLGFGAQPSCRGPERQSESLQDPKVFPRVPHNFSSWWSAGWCHIAPSSELLALQHSAVGGVPAVAEYHHLVSAIPGYTSRGFPHFLCISRPASLNKGCLAGIRNEQTSIILGPRGLRRKPSERCEMLWRGDARCRGEAMRDAVARWRRIPAPMKVPPTAGPSPTAGEIRVLHRSRGDAPRKRSCSQLSPCAGEIPPTSVH
jgi:hypothetical protein